MLNVTQRSALIAVDNGFRIHKTTALALNRKGLIERGAPLGQLQLTEKGKQFV